MDRKEVGRMIYNFSFKVANTPLPSAGLHTPSPEGRSYNSEINYVVQNFENNLSRNRANAYEYHIQWRGVRCNRNNIIII